jgi:hypothetical protein
MFFRNGRTRLMDDDARARLAKRLSAMSLKNARKEIRALDRDASMKFYRNSIWDEYHTLFTLPNAELSITLVEKDQTAQSNRKIGGGPTGSKAQKVRYEYVGVRVEPLTRPAHKRGDTRPSTLTQRED